MRFAKRLCLCACLLGVLSTSAFGAKRAFMSENGAQGSQPLVGDTSVTIAPGGTKTINVFMQDTDGPADNYNGYQLAFPMPATLVTAVAGSVGYIDVPPTGGAGNSVVINTTRADWLFAGTNEPINYQEVAGSRFVVIYNLSGPSFVNPVGIKYCLEFQIQASANACGTWRLPFRLSPAPGSQFNRPGGALVTPITFQSLLITVGQPNDDCADAIAVTGNSTCLPYDTACATTDGPLHPQVGPPNNDDCDYNGTPAGQGIDNDLWYEYTASCTGTLTVANCPPNDGWDSRIAVYGAGIGCTPVGNADLNEPDDCNDDLLGPCVFESGVDTAVVNGQTYLVRVGEFPAGLFGPQGPQQDTLCFACVSNCDPLLPLNDPANIADCGYAGNDPGCTNIGCDAILGCVYTAKSVATPCSDGTVCTTTDHCSGTLGGANECVPGPALDCTDVSPCTIDTCDAVTGCDHDVLEAADGFACNVDLDCQGFGLYGTPNGVCVSNICDCTAFQLPLNGLCALESGCTNVGGQPCAQPDGSDCGPAPDGVFQCSNYDTVDGGVCVDQCCISDGILTVDIELGITDPVPACGAQIFLTYDKDCLDFLSSIADPDGELGWSFAFSNSANEAAGTIDIILSLPPGQACNLATGTIGGGTIARLSFATTGECKCGGVQFRPHNPPNGVGGPNGQIPTVPCEGLSVVGSGAGEILISEPPVWDCPSSIADGNPDCETGSMTVDLGGLQVTDQCGTSQNPPASSLCTVSYQANCNDNLDCGVEPGTCLVNGDCASGSCLPVDPTDPNSPRVCASGICSGGLCPAVAGDPAILNGGTHTFLQGVTSVECSYTNECGQTAECNFSIENTGLPRLDIEVEMSPTMILGQASNPIRRCIDFNLSKCDDTGEETYAFSALITFGAPGNLAGHGRTSVKVPKGNWTCITAHDPKHSLNATCEVECDGTMSAQFKGSPGANPVCHWLIQGNLDNNPEIDIFDYTILAGQYLQNVGRSTLCGHVGYHADLNGDGFVTLSDFTFIIYNFFELAKNKCVEVCNPGAAPESFNPRDSVTIRELVAAGLGQYAAAADVNRDGVVNVTDMSLFIQQHSADQPSLSADLLDAVGNRASAAGLR